jgi:NTE family protein
VGTASLVRTQFFQPIDAAMMWFVEGSLEFGRDTEDLWFDGQPIADYVVDSATLRAAAGRVLGKWGELRATAYSGNVHGRPRIGDPELPTGTEQRGGFELGFRVDTVDEVVFPRWGTEVWSRYTRSSDALGSESDHEQFWASVTHSVSYGAFTLTPYLEYGDNLVPTDDILDQFTLGGIGRLSGLGYDELRGEEVLLARLLAFRRLWQMDFAGLSIRFLAGLSLEAGNIVSRYESLAADNLLTGGAVFVGANTPVGPAYLAYGYTEGGRDRWYFVIGDRF